MTTAATSLLGLALPVTGELQGTWGDTVNNSITSLLDNAVAGTTTLSTDADVTLTTTTLAANQARQAILLWTANGTTTRNITAPAQSKIYTVINKSAGTQSIVLRGAGPTTGVTIIKGESAVCAWNGSDFVKISNTAGTGSFTDLTVSGSLTLSGGTANGVAYLNGSKVLTSGSALTFDGTNFQVASGDIVLAAGNYKLTANDSYLGFVSNKIAINNSADQIKFTIAASEQMRLTSTGLGIGTSSPDVKLRITGANVANKGQLMLDSTNFAQMSLYNGATRYAQIYADVSGSNTGMYIVAATAQPIIFSTSDAERLRLDASGNLGLGVTPSAWNSGAKALQLGTTTTLFNAFNNTYFRNNAYYGSSNDVYLISAAASQYVQTGGQHQWHTAPSGTAGDAISFTQAMTLDASGRLGVGTTSPSGKLQVNAASGDLLLIAGKSSSNGDPDFKIQRSSSATTILNGPNVYFEDGTANNTCAIQAGSGNLQFWNYGAGSWNERMRIDSSGNLLVGQTATGLQNANSVSLQVGTGNGVVACSHAIGTSSGTAYAAFGYGASTAIGSITQNGTTGVLYNITSDYRLKTVIGAVAGFGERIDALEPIEYEWKSNGERTRGFLAHKFQEVYPQSVSGEKDAVDAEGNPVYQNMQASTSEVIADLVAEIQSLRKRLAAAGIA